jgi:hypothetical protein
MDRIRAKGDKFHGRDMVASLHKTITDKAAKVKDDAIENGFINRVIHKCRSLF